MSQNLLTTEGLRPSCPWPEQRELLPPQNKSQSYRAERNDNKSTAVTKEDFKNLQFNALHSFQGSYNAKERIKRKTAVIRNTTSQCRTLNQIAEPGNTKTAR